jgi:hypothetical protein
VTVIRGNNTWIREFHQALQDGHGVIPLEGVGKDDITSRTVTGKGKPADADLQDNAESLESQTKDQETKNCVESLKHEWEGSKESGPERAKG